VRKKLLTAIERRKAEERILTTINRVPDSEALGLLAETTAKLLLRLGISSTGSDFADFKGTWNQVVSRRLQEMETDVKVYLQ
jgi:hypothetical protein